jgi:hypothetical protein
LTFHTAWANLPKTNQKAKGLLYPNLSAFLTTAKSVLTKGPIAIIMAEDATEVDTTLRHHLVAGFKSVLLLAPDEIPVAPDLTDKIHRITHNVHTEGALVDAMNRLIDAAAGQWLYYCYNAEYLFFPFCETRRIGELLAFHTEERRDAVLSYVVDLYAGDLTTHPDAVSLENAHLDRTGYYALARTETVKPHNPKDRQLDFFGGLRWRFEEHVPWTRRKIDRIALFRAKQGLRLRPDFTLTDEEMNTYACPWHNNITTAICSFRTAKALRANPGSRFAINTFHWQNSAPFQWQSQQLMDLGLMEPGQWF